MARTVARTVERSRAVRCRALSLVLVCTSCVSTMATGTDEQTLLLRARCISADSWGAGLPSFWCVELPQIGERRQLGTAKLLYIQETMLEKNCVCILTEQLNKLGTSIDSGTIYKIGLKIKQNGPLLRPG